MIYPTAKEMREITDAKVEVNVKPYLDYIFEKMKESKSNSLNIVYFWNKTGLDAPALGEEDEIYRQLQALGYTVKHNSDPDPGDVRSCGSYTSIHW